MKSTCLVQLTAELMPDERQRWQSFLEARCFAWADAARLWGAAALRVAGQVADRELAGIQIWTELHPGMGYDAAAAEARSAEVLDILLHFVQDEFRQAGVPLMDRWGLRLERWEKLLREQGLRFPRHLRHELQLARQAACIASGEDARDALQATQQALDAWFLGERLRLNFLAQYQEMLTGRPIDVELASHLIDLVDQCRAAMGTEGLVWYLAHQLMAGDDAEQAYAQLRDELELAEGLGSRELLGLCLNHCARQLNAGDQRYLSELLHLYQLGDRKGWLLVNGKLPDVQLRNLLQVAIRMRQFKWATQVLDRYEDRLSGSWAADSPAFHRAVLAYFRGRAAEAVPVLESFLDAAAFFALDAHIYLLQICYEQQSKDRFAQVSSSLKALLQASPDLSEEQVRLQLLYLAWMNRLAEVMPGDLDSLNRLLEEIRSGPYHRLQSWLSMQIKGQLKAFESGAYFS